MYQGAMSVDVETHNINWASVSCVQESPCGHNTYIGGYTFILGLLLLALAMNPQDLICFCKCFNSYAAVILVQYNYTNKYVWS